MALLIGKATLGQNESAGLIFQPLSFFHHRQKTTHRSYYWHQELSHFA